MQKVTSTDIKKALANLHCKEFFITECKNGSTYFPPAQGLLKFDGLAIYKSWTNPKVIIYEIKVSRGDFLQDNKWHLYLQYCHEFYFIVPSGMVKKTELPDNVGLKYYDPDTGAIRTVKKALYRGDITISCDMLMYIFMNKLDSDRIPFYGNNRLQYAKDYLEDKAYKQRIGSELGSKMAKDLSETYKRLEALDHSENDLENWNKVEKLLRKYNVFGWGWYKKEDQWLNDLEEALKSSYPKDLDSIKDDLQRIINRMDKLKEKCSGGKSVGEEE